MAFSSGFWAESDCSLAFVRANECPPSDENAVPAQSWRVWLVTSEQGAFRPSPTPNRLMPQLVQAWQPCQGTLLTDVSGRMRIGTKHRLHCLCKSVKRAATTHSRPMQAVSSESQESHGQKINTTVPFMPSFLFSEKRGLESFLFFFFFLGGEIMCHLLPFLTSYSMFWVQNCLGRASTLWQNYLRTVPSVIPADPICPSDYFPPRVGIWEGSGRVLLLDLWKFIWQRSRHPGKMFIQQMYAFCLEICPAVPV